MKESYKVIVFVPQDDAEELRRAMGEAGAGKIGNYSFCSFSTPGTGRFLPEPGASPHIGEIGRPEEVLEERIEMLCEKDLLPRVIESIRKAHPYEEPAIEVQGVFLPD